MVDPYLAVGMLESCKYIARALEAAALFFAGSSMHTHANGASCDIQKLIKIFSKLVQNRSNPVMNQLQSNVKPILEILQLTTQSDWGGFTDRFGSVMLYLVKTAYGISC